MEGLGKDQFLDAGQDDKMRLRISRSRPTTLRQALEIALELESCARWPINVVQDLYKNDEYMRAKVRLKRNLGLM